MKIIDFEKKGNVVRFYLGEDNLEDWYGDDWDDTPYEHNAGSVYEEFVSETIDLAFNFNCLILEPQDDWQNNGNSNWCKNDMKDRLVPCIIVVPNEPDYDDNNFSKYICSDKIIRIYFGDSLESLKVIECGKEI